MTEERTPNNHPVAHCDGSAHGNAHRNNLNNDQAVTYAGVIHAGNSDYPTCMGVEQP